MGKYNQWLSALKAGNYVAHFQLQKLRIDEYTNTKLLVSQGWYVTERGNKITFDNDNQMLSGTVFYEKEVNVSDKSVLKEPTFVEVLNRDSIVAGKELLDKGYNPAVLNMASPVNPGGGVASGAAAQEETLFRRTNLFRSLYQFVPYASTFNIKRSEKQYPLNERFGGIYTPMATVFREEEKDGFKLLDQPYKLSFITVAGVRNPDLAAQGLMTEKFAELTKDKIRTIFRLGLLHGHDSLVLGALGCGAFHNPPHHVARLFHEVMYEKEFKDKYKYIVFAILNDHNSHKEHNPKGNFLPFEEEFMKK